MARMWRDEMARTDSGKKKDWVMAASFFAFALVMFVVALATAASASEVPERCSGIPHELLMHDTDCREPRFTGAATTAEEEPSSGSGLQWFVVSVIIGVAVLAAVALEAPASRPFVPQTPQTARL